MKLIVADELLDWLTGGEEINVKNETDKMLRKTQPTTMRRTMRNEKEIQSGRRQQTRNELQTD